MGIAPCRRRGRRNLRHPSPHPPADHQVHGLLPAPTPFRGRRPTRPGRGPRTGSGPAMVRRGRHRRGAVLPGDGHHRRLRPGRTPGDHPGNRRGRNRPGCRAAWRVRPWIPCRPRDVAAPVSHREPRGWPPNHRTGGAPAGFLSVAQPRRARLADSRPFRRGLLPQRADVPGSGSPGFRPGAHRLAPGARRRPHPRSD